MGLFGSDEDEREEVTIGISEEDNEENEKNEADVSPEVGTVDFGGSDSSKENQKEESNLRNEVSSLDSVKEAEMDSQKTGSSNRSTNNTGSRDSDIKAIKKQNQKIIEKLDKVLSKL